MPDTVSSERTSKMAWARPGVETVLPGVHRIALPLPFDALTAVNVYVLETADGLLMVDGGWAVPEGRRQLEESLGDIGFAVADIAEILVTHMHRDHYTLGSVLRDELGCVLRLGAPESENLAALGTDPKGGSAQYAMLREAGADVLVDAWHEWLDSQPDDASHYATPSAWIADGDVIDRGGVRLRAVLTPGHTRGHVVFVDEERGLLFSGDHVLPTITPSVGFEPVRDRLALRAFLASLTKVAELGDLSLMPAHGPVGMSSGERIAALIAHHDERLRATLAQVDDGETAFKVASDLKWTRREHAHSDLEPYSRALAVMETEYHLELLQDRGLVSSRMVGGVRFYYRTA
ncbi:MBL fold metallo-hydrolase [Microbacterium sp. No. 7]|uniref:MBL fold metallo-hydrolase n=1 Tax=Microbacterium sp. No. 7 TaxID=1714373 RepID=UPI0006CF2823|nr:MBL fold metallo-hydrolase [Microbacterium sp. No. 7]